MKQWANKPRYFQVLKLATEAATGSKDQEEEQLKTVPAPPPRQVQQLYPPLQCLQLLTSRPLTNKMSICITTITYPIVMRPLPLPWVNLLLAGYRPRLISMKAGLLKLLHMSNICVPYLHLKLWFQAKI